MIALSFATVARWAPTTPEGVHCPTATLQAVAITKRDCCHRIVGLAVRKPRAGEKGFVQCRCAEKRAAYDDPAARTDLVDFVPPVRPLLDWPIRLHEVGIAPLPAVRLRTCPRSPSLRPPLA